MASLERKDRVKDQTSSTSTGTINLDNISKPGFRTVSAAHTSGCTVNYLIISDNFLDWEVGQGVYTSGSPGTLTRVTVFASSNSNALVSFAAGNKTVITMPTAYDIRPVFKDNGSSNAIDYNAGEMQRWAPSSGSQTLTISNWPLSGEYGTLFIEGVNLGVPTITWPTINWVKTDGSFTTTFASNGVTLQASGTDFILLWTRDGGTTIYGKITR